MLTLKTATVVYAETVSARDDANPESRCHAPVLTVVQLTAEMG
jgi:hypothetical protein